AGGSAQPPVNLTVSGIGCGGDGSQPLTSLTGVNDYITIGQNLGNRQIDLGAGSSDTINLGVSGGGYALNLAGVEFVIGTSSNEFVSLVNLANGLSVDLGAGTNDTLNLANGANTLSLTNVENVNASDFAAGNISNDTLTLS